MIFPRRYAALVFHWVRKGAWTILDQALFAGSNFVLNILLARWLSEQGYGAFTVAFAVFLLLGMLHTGWLTEPMLVFGPGRYKTRLPSYLYVLFQGHVGFSLIGGAALGLVGLGLWWYESIALARAFFALAATQPFILFLWYMRRACYIQLRPQWAAFAGGLYTVVMLLGLAWLYTAGRLSAPSALALMAVASLCSGLALVPKLRLGQRLPGPRFSRAVGLRHWRYGRWAASTGLVQWLPGQFAYLVLPIGGGLEASAALRALMNLVMPVTHAYAALSVLMLPAFVRARDTRSFYRVTWSVVALVTVGTVGYGLLLITWGEPLLGYLYGGLYDAYAPLLWLAACLPVASGAGAVLGAALKALERPDSVFWAFAGSSGAALTIGLALILWLGVGGALTGNLIAALIGMGFLVYFLLKTWNPTPVPLPTGQAEEPAAAYDPP